ncbi:terminase small subunit [Agrilactobacillus fermenti]|uniref:terminase small subunit n=1 Tax=Agrilactobacillus fermenti TaxID=2586909 RepID=UPI003A5BF5C9
MKLTVKQQKFADEYIISGNATDAAIKAGYSKKTSYSIGNENLKKPEISKYIEKRRKEISDAKIVDQQEILERLTKFGRGEMTESVATAKGVVDNVPVGAKEQIHALELLGKRFAMWTDKQEINANIKPVEIIDNIPGKEDDADG